MKTVWVVLIVIQCIITYLAIGFGTSLIYSKIEYGDFKKWAKEDSAGVTGYMIAWPCVLLLFIIISPFLIIEYIIEKFAE